MTLPGKRSTPEWAAPHVWEVDDARVPAWAREYAQRLCPPAARVVRVSDEEYVFYAADGEVMDSMNLCRAGIDEGLPAQDPGEALAAHPPLRALRMAMIGFAVLSLFAVLAISIVEGLK